MLRVGGTIHCWWGVAEAFGVQVPIRMDRCVSFVSSSASSTLTTSQCGHSVCPEIPSFKLITGISHHGNKEKVVMASAGVTFSVVLTESGKGGFVVSATELSLNMYPVFTFGSAEKGQLGNGTTGERITTGNKTAFDIEPSPSTFYFFSVSTRECQPAHICSLRERTGRKAYRSDSIRSST